MDERAPVFVKVDEYKAVIEILSLVKERMAKARALLDRINELKQQEDQQIEMWKHDIEDVEDRLAAINKAFLEPQV